jgi:ankyrin repeat protein
MLLSDHGLPVNGIDSNGTSALHFARCAHAVECKKGRLACSPLRSYWGHCEIVRCLLEHGASVHLEKTSGATPLHSATRLGSVEVATVLLDHGAQVVSPQFEN